MLPDVPANVINKAAALWSESVLKYGRTVRLRPNDGSSEKDVKAFCKRPKILGLFDRTEQSYDQERYVVIMRAEDAPASGDMYKFDRVRWDDEDHAVISVTEVEIGGVRFGYRLLVKG